MELNSIKTKATELVELKARIELYRKEWQEVAKPLLIKTLSSVAEEVKIGWIIQTVTAIKNLENVNIQFLSQPSGIRKDDNINHSHRHYSKEGASLMFAQTVNGEILVVVTYPFIEEWIAEKEPETIAFVSPNQITENFILAQVERFLDEMIKWEKSDSVQSRIGF
ncbi:hypothetical protein [Spirosoma panaciterrae]|uniref:hypothetical protein n=1 Tax=Spirosoma panaciterrae TaxID=496058 RepID=UPI00037A5DCE|nr:hypothetical protein [Spirosoma panaciterrae]